MSWSFLLLAASAFGIASCTPADRNFENTGGSGGIGAGGAGGAGGDGAGGAGGSSMVCTPNVDTKSCYTGPTKTLEVGLCREGTAVCMPSGEGFGECTGEVLPAGENCLTPEDEACNGNDAAECPALGNGWLKSFGSPGFTQVIQDVAVTNTGDIVAVGAFADTMDLGLGPMASTGSSDIFVAKFDPTGKALWAKRFGDASPQSAVSVAADSMGGIYVGGTMQGSVDFEGKLITSAGSDDAFLVRFEPDGQVAWARNFGDSSRQTGRRVIVSKTNLVIFAGDFTGTIQFDNGTGNGHTAVGGIDLFIARFDASGFTSTSRGFGGTGTETVRGLALDDSDNVYMTGGFDATIDFDGKMATSTGGRDAYLAKLAPNLTPTTVSSFGYVNGPNSFQEGYDVAIGPAGEVFLSGGFTEAIEFTGNFLSNPDPTFRTMFLVKFDPMLVPNLAQQYGGTGGAIPEARLAIDRVANQLVMAGSFTGDVNFGSGVLTAVDSADLYLAKLGLDTSFVAARTLLTDPLVNDDSNAIYSLALLPSGDLVVGGLLRTPIIYDPTTVGQDDYKFGDAVLGRFIH